MGRDLSASLAKCGLTSAFRSVGVERLHNRAPWSKKRIGRTGNALAIGIPDLQFRSGKPWARFREYCDANPARIALDGEAAPGS